MLLLRLGCRPNELAMAKWGHLDLNDYVLVVPESKTFMYEIPLCPQIVEEFERLRKIMGKLHPGCEYICPPSFAKAKHPRYVEDKDVLAFSGSAGRTTHHSIGAALGIEDRVLDVMEGRTLEKSGAAAAGRHYLARGALGPAAKAAQRAINSEIDRLVDFIL
jgi:integrase